MMRTAFVSLIALSCAAPGTFGHAADNSQQAAIDGEYRKFDKVAAFLRARNAEQFAIKSPKGIDEAKFVTLGGIEQWVTIRGQDRDNPVLLFLHGGPGDVTNPWSFALFAPWLRHFTVVQWDQRGAGRTLRKTGAVVAPTLTVERLAKDGIELAEYLLKRLAKEKIIVVGHSFGSVLGLRVAQARPDLLYAYVGTGQVADETRNYAVAYDALVKKARAVGDPFAIGELSGVGPPPYKTGAGFRTQRKWSNAFEGAENFLFGIIGLTLVAPGGTVQDLNDSIDGQMLSGERLVPQTTSHRPTDFGTRFSVPIFFILGDEDFTTPTSLARDYLETIQAPRKAFVPIPGGHFAVFMHSDRFLAELVKEVRPLAVRR
jgi:pimeloyl-ACP methyl ester carboxylesterase